MRKESRSQTRGSIARQQTQMRTVETVATPRKQSKKASTLTAVTVTSSKDTKAVSRNRSTSASSVSSGRSRNTKQRSVSDDPSVPSAKIQQEDVNVSGSTQGKASSVRKEKSASKTPDRSVIKSRRWVRGGPIEYSTPPSDHGSDKPGVESATDKKSSSDSCESARGKSWSKKNIASTFDSGNKEADVKPKPKVSIVAGGKRKKNAAQKGPTAESKASLGSKVSSGKNAQASAAVKIEPEPTRTKRMARLNAEAIVSLIYKHDEPVASSAKFHDSDSDFDSDSSELSSEEEHTPAVKKGRAKPSPSQLDVAGTSKNGEEHGDHASSKKPEVKSKAKRNSRQSGKLAKSQPKSCKKKPVEANVSSSWSPPKRMASLNAQVCFCPCNFIT